MNPSPEMVEKARGIVDAFDVMLTTATGFHTPEHYEQYLKDRIAETIESAVREAVRELEPYIECHAKCASWDDALCTCGLDAIRKRFELE